MPLCQVPITSSHECHIIVSLGILCFSPSQPSPSGSNSLLDCPDMAVTSKPLCHLHAHSPLICSQGQVWQHPHPTQPLSPCHGVPLLPGWHQTLPCGPWNMGTSQPLLCSLYSGNTQPDTPPPTSFCLECSLSPLHSSPNLCCHVLPREVWLTFSITGPYPCSYLFSFSHWGQSCVYICLSVSLARYH